MNRPDARSLREALARSEPDGIVAGATMQLPIAELTGRSILPKPTEAYRHRNVLVATDDQFFTALALIELDGVAGRLLLCPPDMPDAHLPVIIARAEIDVVVTDQPEHFAEVGSVAHVCWPPRAAGPSPFLTSSEWVLLTSGTTGVPKMVSHSFASLTAPIRARPSPSGPPVWGTFYDIRRYGGLQMYLRGVLGTGSLILSGRDERISDFLQRLGALGVTHLAGTPSHWRRALMSPAITSVAPVYVRLSGEIADQAILDRLKAAFPRAGIGHAYASTEAGVAFEVDDEHEGFPSTLLSQSQTGVEMKVEGGTLRIRSPRTAVGYVGSPELRFKQPDGFVDTGDVVEERGERCYFSGRREGIINVGGAKVHPEEVEAVINLHPQVRMCRVEGRRNPITGAVVVASVLSAEENECGKVLSGCSDLRWEILLLCRSKLAPYKVPALVELVSTMDTTGAGKLARRNA